MAHHRKAIAGAIALNTIIFLGEGIAGVAADSLSLLMDSVHNLSDEMGLVLIFVAYAAASGMSRNLLRSANFFNSVGLLTLSAVLVWQATERLFDPRPGGNDSGHSRSRGCGGKLGCRPALAGAEC